MPRIRNVGGVRPLPFFIHASSFKRSNHWKRHWHKNVLKWIRELGFEFSIHPIFYLRRYNFSESRPILYQGTVYCMFLLYVGVEIDPVSCEQTEQFSTQTDFPYLGLVNVSMITELVRCVSRVKIVHCAFICDTMKLTIFTSYSP